MTARSRWPVPTCTKRLHHEFDPAAESTHLPERPDYERVDAFLIEARRSALSESLP